MNSTKVFIDKLNEELFDSLLPVTVFICLQMAIGFVGNCLILLVYSRAYAQCNFRFFVLFLAVYDLTSCLTTLPGEVYAHFNYYDYKYNWMCKIKSYFNVFTAWGSAFTLLFLALDRCVKICRPLGPQIRPQLAWKLCSVGIVLSSLVSVPILFLWGIQTYPYEDDENILNVSICEKSGLHANDNYPFIYISCVYIGPIGLMMTIICICNILLARKLMCRMYKHRKRKSSNIGFETSEFHKTDSFTSVTAITETIGDLGCQIHSKPIPATIPPTTTTATTTLENENDQCKRSTKKRFWNLTSVYSVPIRYLKGMDNKFNNNTNSGTDIREMLNKSLKNNGKDRTRKRKTLIMLTLTTVYIVTTTTYICLVSLVAEKDGILRKLTNSDKVIFFFFLRLYFVNSIINPILYGIMDPRFRDGFKHLFC